MFSSRTVFLQLIAVAVTFEVAGDILLKQWTVLNRSAWFWFGVAVYGASTVAWAFSLRYELLARAVSVVTIVNLLAVVLVGVLVFGEQLSLVNKLGIALGVVSLVLIEWWGFLASPGAWSSWFFIRLTFLATFLATQLGQAYPFH